MVVTTSLRTIVLVLVATTLALSIAAAGDGILPGDVRLARWLQANPIPLAATLTGFTNDYVTGVPLSIAGHALAASFLIRHRPGPALLVTLATWLRVTNGLLKLAVDSPRPIPDLVAVTERATGLGFPSGHAMGATLVLGAVAYLLTRPSPPLPGGERPGVGVSTRSLTTALSRTATAACLVLILVTGYARILVGAHWPSDVLGGYLWGGVLLLLALRIARRFAGRASVGVGAPGVPIPRARRTPVHDPR